MLYTNGKGKGVSFTQNPITNNLYVQGSESPATPPIPPGAYFWIDNFGNNIVTEDQDFLIFNVE